MKSGMLIPALLFGIAFAIVIAGVGVQVYRSTHIEMKYHPRVPI